MRLLWAFLLLCLGAFAPGQEAMPERWVSYGLGEFDKELRSNGYPDGVPLQDGHLAPGVFIEIDEDATLWAVLPKERGGRAAEETAEQLIRSLGFVSLETRIGGNRTALARSRFDWPAGEDGSRTLALGSLATSVRSLIGPDAWIVVRYDGYDFKPLAVQAEDVTSEMLQPYRIGFGIEGFLLAFSLAGFSLLCFAAFAFHERFPQKAPEPPKANQLPWRLLCVLLLLAAVVFSMRSIRIGIEQATVHLGWKWLVAPLGLIPLGGMIAAVKKPRQGDAELRRRVFRGWAMTIGLAGLAVVAFYSMRWASDGAALALFATGLASTFGAIVALAAPFMPRQVKDDYWTAEARALCAKAGVRFHGLRILETDEPNAMAQPSGMIVLTRGLVDALTVEETRAILAHEIAHLRRRDPMKHAALVFGSGSLLVFAASVLFAFLDIEGGPFVYPIFMVGGLIATTLTTKKRRSREYDADRFAADLIGDPALMAQALRRLQALDPKLAARQVDSLTHPTLEDRIGRLES